MRNKWQIFVLVFIAVAGTLSCNRQTPTESSPTALESPLPAPSLTSPLSPPTLETRQVPSAVPFQIDRPLKSGETHVTGTGPAGVPVRLEDVTFMGRLVGTGKIQKDGTFEITLSKPLEARHRLGLTIDLTDTPWTLEDFASSDFHGSGALIVPQVGFYYDTAQVQED